MKKDILKEFVSGNRDDFDDQEPGSDVLSKIQSRLGLEQPVVAPRRKIIGSPYWWAAAAILVVTIGIAVFLKQEKTGAPPIVKITAPASTVLPVHSDEKDSAATVPAIAANIPRPEQKRSAVRKQPQLAVKKNVDRNTGPEVKIAASGAIADDWRKKLQNESSSARLAAILASGKNNASLSNSDLQALSNTMNSDENSNVRLAALDVLKKHENREAVKDLILQSVARQDDPVVQMELLASLSSGEAVKVKQQLLDITQDPMSIDAVRNEAYAALLRSKSNFLK